MKKVKYKVGEDEAIGIVPCGATILDAYIIETGNPIDESLIYFPGKLTYEDKDYIATDPGATPSLGFAKYDAEKDVWTKSNKSYINLKKQNQFGKAIK